ncbi:MAG: hypothetical protein HYU66_06600 [Armatimonadetes bacterium]|nr:hypothetical protein [Armatimonadota bacterium]
MFLLPERHVSQGTVRVVTTAGSLLIVAALQLPGRAAGGTPGADDMIEFPLGAATPPEDCGTCHQAIYREYEYGFGSDMQNKAMVYQSLKDERLNLPHSGSTAPSAHAFAGTDPFPIHARGAEEEGKTCNVCHFPQPFKLPDLETAETVKPTPRPAQQQQVGVTCTSCHLTPEGAIRGPHAVEAPHASVQEPAMQTSAMCAYCHSLGKRVVGKQTQTFLEWREDFAKPGLGRQQCQDCHMPRTVRTTAEDFNQPARAVARHLWTGGHSAQRLGSALSLTLLQPAEDRASLEFHVINLGAGHSVPTGSNRRGIHLQVEAADASGRIAARQQWLFAPWYGSRPDDRAFLEEDKQRPDAVAATQADAQGPHESSIRAGEERVLGWQPKLPPGAYTIHANLIYDLNRYNDPAFKDDQTALSRTALAINVK